MELLEQAVLRECIREALPALGLRNLKTNDNSPDAVSALHEIIPDIDEDNIVKFLYRQNLSNDESDKVAEACASLLRNNFENIVTYFENNGNRAAANILRILLQENGPRDAHILSVITRNWSRQRGGDAELRGGVYQIIRRYKPMKEEKIRPFYKDDKNHAVICELVYVDVSKMECMIVTTERNIYWGTLYINHQNILYVLAQRPAEHSNSVYQRFYSISLEGGRTIIYSGVCIKSGDTTHLPLAAECLFVEMPRTREYEKVYKEFDALLLEPWGVRQIDENSTFLEYITDKPPSQSEQTPQGEKRVRNFKMLTKMVKEDDEGIIMMRESLRALSVQEKLRLVLDYSPRAFRQSRRRRK